MKRKIICQFLFGVGLLLVSSGNLYAATNGNDPTDSAPNTPGESIVDAIDQQCEQYSKVGEQKLFVANLLKDKKFVNDLFRNFNKDQIKDVMDDLKDKKLNGCPPESNSDSSSATDPAD